MATGGVSSAGSFVRWGFGGLVSRVAGGWSTIARGADPDPDRDQHQSADGGSISET
jgi:hypothetical protein